MQLRLPPKELDKLKTRIAMDYDSALNDHGDRIERFRRYYQKWRNRVDAPRVGEEEASNFSVPLLQWQTYSKLAASVQSILGDDAEVVAVPVGPSDQRTVAKIGRYMSWRVLKSMQLVDPLTVFLFRMILFGRSHAYSPWVRETYPTPNGEEVWYDGPGFSPLWPDDLILPAENVTSIQEFSWVIRKYRATPQQLLDGEREGRYAGIRQSMQELVDLAAQGPSREARGEEIQGEKDLAEGVLYDNQAPSKGTLIVHEWYGKWRLPKGRAQDPSETSLKGRNIEESDLVVRYLPDAEKIIGVQDLMELYPNMRDRRPFVEGALVKDGSYWSPGFGELLEWIQDEATTNHNLFTEAGQFSVGPVVFYRPSSGFKPDKFRYEPFAAYPTDDPAGVNVVNMRADLQYSMVKEQAVLGYAERVTGVSDMAMGRTIDRPNAPRTATGQVALLEQGNIRASLDVLMMREDFRKILGRFWALDSEFSPESVFFRVTEEEAAGLFDVRNGGATMTAAERGGRFDFDIRFATSVWSREAKKQQQMTLYQLDLQNPLIATNPRALWMVTREIHRALGDSNFADLVPEPPDLDQPKNPRDEWTRMLQGEDIEVNPLDNDDLHIVDHRRRATEASVDQERDDDALNRMAKHLLQHVQQKQQKKLMQALANQMGNVMAEAMQSLPPAMPMQQPGMGQQNPMMGPGGANGSPGPAAGQPPVTGGMRA